MLENDPTQEIFKFTLKTLDNGNEEVINKIKRILYGDHEVCVVNKEDIKVLRTHFWQ
jgi:hypothetical protein